MSDTFQMKPGDRKFALQYKLSDYVLSGAMLVGASVVFQMKNRAGAVVINSAGVVLDDDGIVAYNWGATDTLVEGFYDAEFKITFADTLVQHYPSCGFISVRICSDVPEA